MNTSNDRFRDRDVTFANGAAGRNLDITSANPRNYHQAIAEPEAAPTVTVDGKLFVPTGASGTLPCVIVTPGSLGVADSHVGHAETLTDLGFAAFVLDSFGARAVTSTVANQTQFSFAASALDVLAAVRVLRDLPEIDADRIGAQGHSRGGTAVLTAATRVFANAVLGPGEGLCAVYAAYPWSGHQFLSPGVGSTIVRTIMGDADEWCSPMQAQGHMQAIRLAGGVSSFRLLGGVHHSFDRGAPVVNIPEASVSPAAPTAYIADDGAFLHPLSDAPDMRLVDRDLMIYGIKAGFGRKGAKIGGTAESATLFKEDISEFWQRVMV
ncbi:MAG: dienelactone hydrolase family protein [Minwuia sp.]|uniref:dienelactone hydrolase family protein n=1 Tax=Minwuia sp. TaxID=2493630 RepID=UPI003A8A593F